MAETKYKETLRVRTLPGDKTAWAAAAAAAHMEMSAWVRVMLHAAAEKAKTDPAWWQGGAK